MDRNGKRGGHAVLLIGWDDTKGAYLCKNSWGTNWGASGWFRIGYGECGIDTEFAMYGVDDVVPPGTDPEPEPEPEPEKQQRIA